MDNLAWNAALAVVWSFARASQCEFYLRRVWGSFRR